MMFKDGGSPKQIKKYVVRDPQAYKYEELDALVKTHTAFPILCGFDCTSDVEQLAGGHEHLTQASISKNHLSWHLLVDNTLARALGLQMNCALEKWSPTVTPLQSKACRALGRSPTGEALPKYQAR